MNVNLTRSDSNLSVPQSRGIVTSNIKRTFSESIGFSLGAKPSERIAAKYEVCLAIQKDMLETQKQNQSAEIQEIQKESTQDNDTLSSNQGTSSRNDDDLKAKLRKVTQAQLMGKTAGRWTKEEHKKFVQAIRIYGKDWKKVEEYVETRSGAQIRSHAQKYFIRIQKKLKGNSATYLNQSEDQCNTTKGLELFRQTIALYEEGIKDDQDDEEEYSYASPSKRQKFSTTQLGNLLDTDKLGAISTTEPYGLLGVKPQGSYQDSTLNRFSLSQKDSQIQILNLQDISQANDPAKTGVAFSANSFFLQNEFMDLVKRKELIMTDIYFNDKVDLFSDGRKYLTLIQDILNDIQKLSQKLTIVNQLSSILEPSNNTTVLLERLLILINEVVNLQKVLTDLVSNNELLNKPISKPISQASTQQQSVLSAMTSASPASNPLIMSLLSQITPPQSQTMINNQANLLSQQQLLSTQNSSILSQLTSLFGLQAQVNKGMPSINQQTLKTDSMNVIQQKYKAIQIIQGKETK